MSLSYELRVETVGHTWVSTDTTAPVAGGLADPATFHIGAPLAPGWWQQHDFTTCSFTILGTADDLHDLDLDADVYVRLTVAGENIRELRGAVVAITAERRRGSLYGFTVTVVDALRRLTQVEAGGRACPAETIADRWARLVAQAGAPVAPILLTPNADRLCSPRPAEPRPLWELLVGLTLDVSGLDGTGLQPPTTMIIETWGTPGSFTYTPLSPVGAVMFPYGSASPWVITDQAGPTVSLVARTPAPQGALTRPACEFREGTWTRQLPDRVTAAVLTGATFEVTGRIDTHPATFYSRATSLADPAAAQLAAEFHLNATHPTTAAWQADAVEWKLWHADPVGLDYLKAETAALIVTDTQTDVPATPRGLLAGLIREATITLAGGRVTVLFQLDPLTTPNYGADWSTLAAAPFTTRTWSQLNPADTWHDYRLADI